MMLLQASSSFVQASVFIGLRSCNGKLIVIDGCDCLAEYD